MRATAWAAAGVVVLAAAAAGGYVWSGAGKSSPAAGPALAMSIALNPQYAGSGLVLVAQHKGYFTEEGLQVELKPHSSGRVSVAAALERKADLGTVSEVAYVDAVAGGAPGTIVATIFRSSNDHGVIGRADQGFRSPADLKGKRVGVTPGTSGDFVLDGFLLREGLSAADVTVHGYKPDEFDAALERGEIDAVVTWQPVLGRLRDTLGTNAAVFYSGGIYELTFNLAGHRDYVAANPEAIQRLLRALVRAEQFMREQPEAARGLIAEFTGSDPARLAAQWPNFHYQVTLDQSLLIALEDVGRWKARATQQGGNLAANFLDHLHLGGLASVKPDAVTVIH